MHNFRIAMWAIEPSPSGRNIWRARFVAVVTLATVGVGLTLGVSRAVALAAPSASPVGYWRFDEGSGTTVSDSSGFGNTGTAQNGMTWGAGRIGKGGVFDGANAQVRIADSPSLSISGTALTIAAWVKPTAGDGYRVIVHKERQYSLAILNGQLTYADSVTWSYSTLGAYGSIPVGSWSHVVVTFDGRAIAFYVNGALVGSKLRPGAISDNANPVCVAAYNCSGLRFGGTLDEVSIYASALSATDVQSLAGTPTATSTPAIVLTPTRTAMQAVPTSTLTPGTTPTTSGAGPTGYWRFDEGSGTRVGDSSGFANTGTAQNGMTWSVGRIGGGGVFDGTNAQVQIANSPSLNVSGSGLTVTAWVKPSAVDSYRVIVHKEAQYSLALLNGQLTYADSATWSYAAIGAYGSIPAGAWSHLAVTFDGSVISFYINGTLVGSKPRAGAITTSANPVCLAAYNCQALRFGGTLDEVAVYARALSPTELQTLASAGTPPTATSSPTASRTLTAMPTHTLTPLANTPTSTATRTPTGTPTPTRTVQPTSSATPTPTPSAVVTGGPAIGGCPVFPANNIWNRRVDALPVDPNSQAYVTNAGGTPGLHPDFGAGSWDGGPVGIPYAVVPGTQQFVSITFVAYGEESDPGPYPVPTNAPIEGGSGSTGDRHVLVVDSGHCVLYELYNAWPQADGSWQADSGAVFNLGSNAMRPAGWTSADAAGFAIVPGLVRYDEVASGAINHALRFTVPRTRKSYVWPARHYASSSTDATRPPMGQRFRLKASFNISPFSSTNQVILQALKTYGMFVADNGSAWYLSGAPDDRWNNDDLHNLQTGVHGSDFEAVDESSLMIDANSAQSR